MIEIVDRPVCCERNRDPENGRPAALLAWLAGRACDTGRLRMVGAWRGDAEGRWFVRFFGEAYGPLRWGV